VYTNDPDALGGGERALPSIMTSDAIEFHFARAGWGSVWLSLLTSTPLLMPPYRHSDDPEIRYNVQAIEELGIGDTYKNRGKSLSPERGQRIRSHMRDLRDQLRGEYGKLNGIEIAASEIVSDLTARGELGR
jgi:hypothetical protein